MEVRFRISDRFMKELMKESGLNTSTDVAREAFTLLKWALDQAEEERIIFSADKDGSNPSRLAMPSLSGQRAK